MTKHEIGKAALSLAIDVVVFLFLFLVLALRGLVALSSLETLVLCVFAAQLFRSITRSVVDSKKP